MRKATCWTKCWWTTAHAANGRKPWTSVSLSEIRPIPQGRNPPTTIMPTSNTRTWTQELLKLMLPTQKRHCKINCTTATSAPSAGHPTVSVSRALSASSPMRAGWKPIPQTDCGNVWQKNFPACISSTCEATPAHRANAAAKKKTTFSDKARAPRLPFPSSSKTRRRNNRGRFTSTTSATT